MRTFENVPARFKCEYGCMDLLEHPRKISMGCKCQRPVIMCQKCLEKLLNNSCPLCKMPKLSTKLRSVEKRSPVEFKCTALWKEIQDKYPEYDYEDDNCEFAQNEEDVGVQRKLARVGEVGKEFIESQRVEIERRKEKENEENEKRLAELAKTDKGIATQLKNSEDQRKSEAFIRELYAKEKGHGIDAKGCTKRTLPGVEDGDPGNSGQGNLHRSRKKKKSEDAAPTFGISCDEQMLAQQQEMMRRFEKQRKDEELARKLHEQINGNGKKHSRPAVHMPPTNTRAHVNLCEEESESSQKLPQPLAGGGLSQSSSENLPRNTPSSTHRKSTRWECKYCSSSNKKRWLRCQTCGNKK
jgi:hypothetical protein